MDFSSDSFPSLQASQAKKRSITDMDDDDGEQTACCHHDRCFIVQSTDSNKAASKLSPFVIDKALKCSIGTVKTVRCLRQGDIPIEVSSATQSSAVTKLNTAGSTTGFWINYANEPSQTTLERASQDIYDFIPSTHAARRLCKTVNDVARLNAIYKILFIFLPSDSLAYDHEG